MKKYIYGLFFALVSVAMFTACSADEGTDPGNDSKAMVTLYQYTVSKPYDADADTEVRIVTNSATTEAYSLVEAKSAYDSHITELGTDGYNEYVVKNGEKVDNVSGFSTVDKYFTGLSGDVVITVVAVGNGTKSSKSVSFKALAWETVATGTYYFGASSIQNVFGAASTETTLQKCSNEDGLYRFVDLYGQGYNLKFTLTGATGSDEYGSYSICHVAAQSTGLQYGTYGDLGVRDVATWQNSDDYLENNVMYDSNNVVLWNQYYVSAGNTGYGYDQFVPNN